MALLQTLQSLEYTLNLIEVHGKNNLDMLGGCIEAVVKLKEAMIDIEQGGSADGRQTDIGADGSDLNNE